MPGVLFGWEYQRGNGFHNVHHGVAGDELRLALGEGGYAFRAVVLIYCQRNLCKCVGASVEYEADLLAQLGRDALGAALGLERLEGA